MNFSLLKKILVALIALMIVFWLAQKVFIGEESRIKKTLDKAAAAIENEDQIALLSVFAQDYQDDTGISYGMVFKIAATGFKKYDDIAVDLSSIKITVNGDRAEAVLDIWGEATVASTKGKNVPAVRESFQQTKSRIFLMKMSGDWKIYDSKRISFATAIR